MGAGEMAAHDLIGRIPVSPRFVIFSSYGNDSVALIQWAHEQGLRDVVVVYSDTQWAADWWAARVEKLEWWVHSLGFWTDRTTSVGFVELAKQKKAFPTQQFQWCSYILKIEPGERWLTENDPDRRAACLVGVRREESDARADFPRYLVRSGNHGDRIMLAPFADFTEEQRDDLLRRAGVESLPHRSMECSPCVNSNRKDLQALTESEIVRLEAVEHNMTTLFGMTKNGKPRTIFRPHRHMGAVGIREVVKWAHAGRGKYRADVTASEENGILFENIEDEDGEDLPPEKDEWVCNNGYCAN